MVRVQLLPRHSGGSDRGDRKWIYWKGLRQDQPFLALNHWMYDALPEVEQTLKNYLSSNTALSLNPPTHVADPTSALVGKAYITAGQAGACLHNMSLL